MIKIYKDLNVYDFRNDFSGLDNTAWVDEWQALGVLYDYLESLGDESLDDMEIKDWLRFEVLEMTEKEIQKNYNILFNDYPNVEEFLEYHAIIYGTYESNGETYYLFVEY